jgi:queuine tRNA-ribosyltransferase
MKEIRDAIDCGCYSLYKKNKLAAMSEGEE